MQLTLKDFQDDAVVEVVQELRMAARESRQTSKMQAVGLSSVTGSGKTVISTACIERLLQGDSENTPLDDAVFLWITDQPELNEQTRKKMLLDSSLLGEHNVVTIGPAFDQERFTSGTVNFINIQKLGKGADLVTKGDTRDFTFWQTVSNTIAAIPDRFFIIIDEAHRGMAETPKSRAEANSIIQKFIKGSAGEIPPCPLVVGISATLDRYTKLVSGTGRTIRSIDIPVDAVRESGLLKDVVTLFHPSKAQPTDITMLREATRMWKRFEAEWETHCKREGEPVVRPILVIQVEDAAGKRISKTNLDEIIAAIEDEIGGIPEPLVAHAFQEGVPISAGGKEVRYLAPSEINADPDVGIVLFKTSLNTGWDCPRAEVMMSFRKAVDATSIAQLVGRMVRAPLARGVDANDFLNTVALYLPHYDEEGLARVIERLTTPDPDTLPPVEIQRGENLTFPRAASDEIFAALEAVPNYIVPSSTRPSQVRRLMKLARALSNHEVEPDAEDKALKILSDDLAKHHKRVSKTATFKAIVKEHKKVKIKAIDWQVGLDYQGNGGEIVLDVATENIDDLFEAAGRHIGDEGLHKAWWKARRAAGVDNTTAKLELVALSLDPDVRKSLEESAQKTVTSWLRQYRSEVKALPEGKRSVYAEVQGLAKVPEVIGTLLPQEISVSKADRSWKRHAYADGKGEFTASLNKWETLVLEGELARPEVKGWLRNLPRKPWAIKVPYLQGGRWKAFYPDLLLVVESNGELVVDLLDPHHIDLADAPAKAAGLAAYAAKHAPSFNRIELIIVRGKDEIRRIDLNDESRRDKVLAVQDKSMLELLFDEFATPAPARAAEKPPKYKPRRKS